MCLSEKIVWAYIEWIAHHYANRGYPLLYFRAPWVCLLSLRSIKCFNGFILNDFDAQLNKEKNVLEDGPSY